ncbi:ammonia permease [Brevibacterium sp. 50QC2O2]|uniref:ammonia permease n=1 Tax=Brevibacterium TaxID=1696 RepID=UPI00211B78C0|nr:MULTISPECIES: ammonia permease [unclassified Brevibacterium]MCQ9368921.1 ammonia permease [Brevibacterium sp. 91QC2O2]MCQ9386004.1 ammonia permease [Brevibacterium sp. 68QC2CO]MCQ9387705.1 ammonia permease [Brevibacterium sp. 50QC2O2]
MNWIRVVVALLLAVTLGVTSVFGYVPVVMGSALVVVFIAFGWPRLTDTPQPHITSLMLGLFGLAGMAATWLADHPPYLEWLPILAALGLLWSFVQNLSRGIDADNAVANVSAHVAGVVIVLSTCSWAAAIRLAGERNAVIMGLVAIMLAQCATAMPWPGKFAGPLAVVLGIVGANAIYWLDGSTIEHWGAANLLGLLMGLVVIVVDRMLGKISEAPYQAGSLHKSQKRQKARQWGVQLALGATPIAVGGIAVYIVERIPGII